MRVDDSGGRATDIVRNAPCLIGELGVVLDEPRRTADVTAIGPVEALEICEQAIAQLPSDLQAPVWRGLMRHAAMKLQAAVPLRAEALGREMTLNDVLAKFVNPHARSTMQSEFREEFRTETVVVLFSDLEGFSAVAERCDPDVLSRFMKDVLSRQSVIIEAAGGYIDKFIGDAVMAYWRILPSQEQEVAGRAVAAAEAIAAELNTLRYPVSGDPVRLRIGLELGEAKIGNFGSLERWAFTAIGETVNRAARLEQARGHFGPIRIGGQLREKCAATVQERFRHVASAPVKDRTYNFFHTGE
ncbi:MAG TPA: hypothetical protein DCL54_19585 [Alphaproteobacteria bacterium]|nr:hypothetical protein [Alphaproteobacteria bacterium]